MVSGATGGNFLEIVDGSTTWNSREYFAVRSNNRVSMPTHGQSHLKSFERQIIRFLRSDARRCDFCLISVSVIFITL